MTSRSSESEVFSVMAIRTTLNTEQEALWYLRHLEIRIKWEHREQRSS